MWSEVFLVVTTVLSIAYAHYAYRQSVRAPILKISLLHPQLRKPVEFSTDPRVVTKVNVSAAEYRSALPRGVPDGAMIGMRVPVLLTNVGTKTARWLKLHIRYSAIFDEIGSTGTRLANADGTALTIIEHEVPDIHPKLYWIHEGDFLHPTETLLDGLSSETLARTKDGVMMRIGWKAKIDGIIEFILYSEDTEPIFQRCRISAVPNVTSSAGDTEASDLRDDAREATPSRTKRKRARSRARR